MSTQSTPPKAKRGRKPVKIKKVRQNISIDQNTLKKARKMAFNDHLALSTWLARLVEEKAGQITTQS